jgi:hypothetical protein
MMKVCAPSSLPSWSALIHAICTSRGQFATSDAGASWLRGIPVVSVSKKRYIARCRFGVQHNGRPVAVEILYGARAAARTQRRTPNPPATPVTPD